MKFATHALWPETGGGFDVFVAVTACAAFLAMKFFKVPFTAVLAACALLGLLTGFI